MSRKPQRTVVIREEIRPDVNHHDVHLLAKRLKDDTGCEVVPRLNNRRQVERFDIFGSGSKLDATVKAINRWIESTKTRSSSASSWAKMPAYDFNKWYYEEIKIMENDRKQKFKKSIPNDCPYCITIAWPSDLLSGNAYEDIEPRIAFGNKLEGLDSIRMEDEVWIQFSRTSQTPRDIEIYSYDMTNIKQAEQHYLTLIEKFRASKTEAAEINIVLDKDEGDEIILAQSETWSPSRKQAKVELSPYLVHLPMNDEPGNFRRKPLSSTYLAMMQRELSQSLETIKFARGSYELSIRFGCVALQGRGLKATDIGKKYAVKAFLNSVDIGIITSKTQAWAFNHRTGEQVLSRLTHAANVLAPVRPSGTYGMPPPSLKLTRPTFRGIWALHDPNRPMAWNTPAGLGRPNIRNTVPVHPPSRPSLNIIVVRVEWTEDEESCFEKMPARFYRLKAETGIPSEHLDINLFELGSAKAWHFGIERMFAVPPSTISPIITQFADSIKMRPGYSAATNSLDSFATWNMTPSIKIHWGKLERVHTFGIKDTGYIVEHLDMWYPGEKEPCCGLTVRHTEWASHLVELERLPTGYMGKYGNAIRTFFPDDGHDSGSNRNSLDEQLNALSINNPEQGVVPGLKLLMDKLMQVSAIVSGDEGGSI